MRGFLYTPLKLIDLDLKRLVLLVEDIELGLQGQQMRLHPRWGLIPVRLGKGEIPSRVFSWGGHHSYLWPLVWIEIGQNSQLKQRVKSRIKYALKELRGPCERVRSTRSIR